ncbi:MULTISPECIES: PHB depolymerase family esterase [unclassified Micromonospora]|uniref:extracellular catalytic domain type 1 short-chain-length polyhydroxyalkanoate depolymerase n=1 Tax=unclassified Micromonospora TaxID=2617518 RepID=UPI001C23E5F5|nr:MULTISPECIES: PHB depolymerase family esterase [unclassified Micromonospora]MBU8856306.1 PHB depolymerase family esterase [Micromonospora sp. WMMB482]MDM4781914.1 PHB depolymerase family esterase [Micromonospora sp. b486]
MPRSSSLIARVAGAAAGVVLAAATALVAALPAQAASLTQVTGFGSNPGNLAMYAYRPDGLPAGAPAVVLLHGCVQNASTYVANSGWQKYADQWKFTLIAPQQPSGNNANSCFNWFETGDTARGQGEALSIKQMVDYAKNTYGTDGARVYVSGLSAGGAMSATMLATYPDVFAAGSIIAGIPYRCATSMINAFSCMNPGVNKTPAQWGDLVRGAYSGYSGKRPRVAIWHGTSDTTVATANAVESRDQWTNVLGVSATPTSTSTLPAGTSLEVYGSDQVRLYRVSGMGHGTPVDPGSGADQCGAAGAYFLDTICSTYRDAVFFGLGGGGSSPSPTPTATASPKPTASPTPSPTPTPTSAPVCVTASNYAHVVAGRAYQSGGYAYALGSGQRMGLYNTFYTSTLKQTGPAYWVIGC